MWPIHEPKGETEAALIAVFFGSIGLQLWIESRWNLSAVSRKAAVGGLIMGMSAAAFYFLQNSSVEVILSFIAAFIGLAMVASFLKRDFDPLAMSAFLSRVGITFLLNGLLSLILWMGFSLIVLSLKHLFDVNTDLFLERMALVLASVVWPILTMMQIPTQRSLGEDKIRKSKSLIVVENVISSLWLAFAAVINLYAFKIAIIQSLPRGKASSFVIALAFLGFLAVFLISSEERGVSWPSRALIKSFGYVLIAPLTLMGVGVWTRIYEYGLTPARYYLVLLLTVFILSVLYVILVSKLKSIRFFLCALSVALLASTIPPLRPLEMSVSSQRSRLRGLLEKNQVLVGNELRKDHPVLSAGDVKKIRESLDFLNLCDKSDIQKTCFEEGLTMQSVLDAVNNKDKT